MNRLAFRDEYTPECLSLDIAHGITADRMFEVLLNSYLANGATEAIRSDKGSEFIASGIRRTGNNLNYFPVPILAIRGTEHGGRGEDFWPIVPKARSVEPVEPKL